MIRKRRVTFILFRMIRASCWKLVWYCCVEQRTLIILFKDHFLYIVAFLICTKAVLADDPISSCSRLFGCLRRSTDLLDPVYEAIESHSIFTMEECRFRCLVVVWWNRQPRVAVPQLTPLRGVHKYLNNRKSRKSLSADRNISYNGDVIKQVNKAKITTIKNAVSNGP